MDIHLLAFVTVAEERSFTHAAEKLHISQPAISQHVQTLEKRLDVQLLERNKRSVRLTKAGEIAYQQAKDILCSYARMTRLIEDLRGKPSGPLTIGASFTFGEYVLPHLIADFRLHYPDVTPIIEIHNTRAVADLVARGQLDIGIIEGSTHHQHDLAIEPLASDQLTLVASSGHPFANQANITVEDLNSVPWMIREPGSGTREITETVFAQLHLRPAVVQEYASTQLIKESVLAGLGVALLSKWVVHRELQWRALVELPFQSLPVKRTFSVVLKQSNFTASAVSCFRNYLFEHVPTLSEV
ncbi:LysR family transcriptional regulator [Alicyclobacillus cycloheptanicus]|uniref:DNA-binding transcriptional LysR family regulator n=1 Tax=Alicyclobacillus cycloheptanicus TaxID=1457 RepID=A0ABT9XKN8_9BACL|nr:LysR family transcriptional regulator [Alicyclobacillus cycloheptanicus]MDQ0190874.1 DNA-binding transcriptional LysR family regulator [Alicyclobacillus cycloheptanicus]WDM01763.1 LysR family transcriptional regulator [Alicyclobacillus cycloheptanicus]